MGFLLSYTVLPPAGALFFKGPTSLDNILEAVSTGQEMRRTSNAWNGWNASETLASDASYSQTPAMDSAYLKARQNTMPAIDPNITDRAWYREHYAVDKDNRLEQLSFSSPHTALSKEVVAAQDKKETAAWEKIAPRLQAEAAEAAKYYHEVFVHDKNNDLDAYSDKRTASGTVVNASARTGNVTDSTA